MRGLRRREIVMGIGAAPVASVLPAITLREEPHFRLRRYWAETKDPNEDPKGSFRSPASVGPAAEAEAKVQALETKYGLKLPSDFRDYLIYSAPAGDNWDVAGHNWWPIDRIRSVRDEREDEVDATTIARQAESCLVFGDYLIWCSAWAIQCGEGADRGMIVRVGGSGDSIIGADFAEFVDRYIADPWSVA